MQLKKNMALVLLFFSFFVVIQDMEISIRELRTILNRVVTRREFSV